MRIVSLITLLLIATACQKTGKEEGSAQLQGFTELGEPYSCSADESKATPDDSCALTDEIKAFTKSCSDSGYQVSKCGCIHLCSSRISAVCTEDARIDCIKKEDGTYESQGVGRSGFACAFPPVPANAVDISFCQPGL